MLTGYVIAPGRDVEDGVAIVGFFESRPSSDRRVMSLKGQQL
jgi:hypothetical protein